MEKEEKDNIKKDKKLINKKKTRPEKSPTKNPQKENKLKETAFYKEDNIDIDTEIKNDEKELGLIEENENEKDNKTTANNIK